MLIVEQEYAALAGRHKIIETRFKRLPLLRRF
jgi:hypothetical protein